MLKEDATVENMASTLALISLKIAQFTSKVEVYKGDDHLSPSEKVKLYDLYRLANRHFTGDDSDIGKLYSDEEMVKIRKLVEDE